MPDDQEFEYLPTQAIADFLATEGKAPLDGILYPSEQVTGGGLNAVLFHKAARCKELDFPKGTKFSARTFTTYEDGPELDYCVTIEVPPEREVQEEEKPEDFFNLLQITLSDYDDDERKETLSIDLESMTVHYVNAVQINSTEFNVRWHQRETKSAPSF